MAEEVERHPEPGEEHSLETPRRAFARALTDILDSATAGYPESEDKKMSCVIALVGQVSRPELAKLIEEMPVVADVDLSAEFGNRSVFLFDISTATRVANFITSGRVEKDVTARGQHISSLHQFVRPIVDAFTGACKAATGRAFGSLQSITVCDRNERERLLEDLPGPFVRATALITAGGEPAGKMAVVLPLNVIEILAEPGAVSAQTVVSPFERMELERMDDSENRLASYGAAEPPMENIDLILDIQLKLNARLGHVEMPIGEIMKLAPGSVIDIDRLVDEPIELVINDRPIARGEIVVVQENFGIKITEIISQKDRIRSLV
ncbi:MAG: flagellar motor switch protein FliN [Candidatus Abyssobacteria bacterium SURF_5]|uniref:Flagellar motor switch protein FliN n=1 Tax=Abyssobacteria bacterium (strain SURF_5) TaxID=2093360 RepID=A0A3A4NV96_ABYX5|nr:MAG: flagellar motor switch protein FliN [Candidatus Abyssubacteria bacterium SURF_5]